MPRLLRTLAAAAALALAGSACAAEPTTVEAQVNARLDASLHKILGRLARAATSGQNAPSAPLAQRVERPVATASSGSWQGR